MQVYVIKGTFNQHPTLTLVAQRQATTPTTLSLKSIVARMRAPGKCPSCFEWLRSGIYRGTGNKTWMTLNSKQDN